MRRACRTLLALSACGDNIPIEGPRVQPASTMFVAAHFDDDMIFMQPDLLRALQSGSVTTIYVTSGDAVHGNDRADHTFMSAQTAYSSAIGSSVADWDCGYLPDNFLPVHHCRSRVAPVSMIGLDVPDGGLDGTLPDGLLHLVENRETSVPILGPVGGRATIDDIIGEIVQLVIATNPSEIHALDLAATHGRDHSSHMFSSTFAFWAAARVGYSGAFVWHRGYNVADAPVTLSDADFAAVAPMLGYFEACYFGCGDCGKQCPPNKLDVTHVTWIKRQYSSSRVATASGVLAAQNATACMTPTGTGALAAGDCATATPGVLDATGHLTFGAQCLASAPDDTVALAPCAVVPEQYWLLDSEGLLWNGLPPRSADGMDYDHVRCLSVDPQLGAIATAPTCGAHVQPRWQFGP
jgi:hypothetical protein